MNGRFNRIEQTAMGIFTDDSLTHQQKLDLSYKLICDIVSALQKTNSQRVKLMPETVPWAYPQRDMCHRRKVRPMAYRMPEYQQLLIAIRKATEQLYPLRTK